MKVYLLMHVTSCQGAYKDIVVHYWKLKCDKNDGKFEVINFNQCAFYCIIEHHRFLVLKSTTQFRSFSPWESLSESVTLYLFQILSNFAWAASTTCSKEKCRDVPVLSITWPIGECVPLWCEPNYSSYIFRPFLSA